MKKFLLLIVCIIMVFILSSCISVRISDKNASFVRETKSQLTYIDGLLSYDINTKIIYYYFKDTAGSKGYGFMSPYYSENGKLCKYDITEKKIIELK